MHNPCTLIVQSCLSNTKQIKESLRQKSKSDYRLLYKVEKTELLLEQVLQALNTNLEKTALEPKFSKLESVLVRILEYSKLQQKRTRRHPFTSLNLYKMVRGFVSKLERFEKSLVNAGIVSMKLKTQAKSIFSRGSNSTVFVPEEITRDKEPRSLSFSDESYDANETEDIKDQKNECISIKNPVISASDKIKADIQEIIDNAGARASVRNVLPQLEAYSKEAAIHSVGIGNVLVSGSCAVVSKQSFVHNSFDDCGIFSFLYPMQVKLPSPNMIGELPKSCADAAEATFTRLKKLVPESYLTVFSVPKYANLPIPLGLEFSYYVLGDYISVAFLSVGALANGSKRSKLDSEKMAALGVSQQSINIWSKKISGLNMSRYSVGECIKTGNLVVLSTPRWKGIKSSYLCIDSFWAFPQHHPGLRRLELKRDSLDADHDINSCEIVSLLYTL